MFFGDTEEVWYFQEYWFLLKFPRKLISINVFFGSSRIKQRNFKVSKFKTKENLKVVYLKAKETVLNFEKQVNFINWKFKVIIIKSKYIKSILNHVRPSNDNCVDLACSRWLAVVMGTWGQVPEGMESQATIWADQPYNFHIYINKELLNNQAYRLLKRVQDLKCHRLTQRIVKR